MNPIPFPAAEDPLQLLGRDCERPPPTPAFSFSPLTVRVGSRRRDGWSMKIVPEPPPDAERGVVGGVAGPAEDLGDDPSLVHVQDQAAAEPAMGTGGLDPLGLPGPAFHGAQVLRQGAHRAEREALPAGDAVVAVARRDLRRKSLSRRGRWRPGPTPRGRRGSTVRRGRTGAPSTG